MSGHKTTVTINYNSGLSMAWFQPLLVHFGIRSPTLLLLFLSNVEYVLGSKYTALHDGTVTFREHFVNAGPGDSLTKSF